MYSGRRWLGSSRTVASLFGSFAAESRAVVVGAQRGRTVHCHFRGLGGADRPPALVRLTSPRHCEAGTALGDLKIQEYFFLWCIWKAKALVQSHLGHFERLLSAPMQQINCGQNGGMVLYGASVIHAINK